MLKLCELYPDETVYETTDVFIQAFIDRFQKITLDLAHNHVLLNAADEAAQV